MLMTCIIVEDQPPAQRILKKYIEDIGGLDLKQIFSDALAAMKYLQLHEIDLIFLDIHLPKLSGIDLIKLLDRKPHIILTTAFSDYALDGYDLDVVDYLLKPFSFERFVRAVNKAKGQLKEASPIVSVENKWSTDWIFVKSGSEYLNLEVRKIEYIKSDGDYTEVHIGSSRKLINHSLKFWTEHLPEDMFCQVHKSYIVNVSQIQKVVGNQLYIEGAIIPVGRMYKEGFFERYL